MDYEAIKEDFEEKISTCEIIEFDNGEEYFFILGQFINYIFDTLGGPHKYKNALNYLTDPYIPKSIKEIGERNINFLNNLPKLFPVKDMQFNKVYKALIEDKSKFINDNTDELLCSDSFFKGLHGNNLFMEIFH